MEKKIILVTGASGLVGSALQYEVKSQKLDNEEFIFLSSKDADLTYIYIYIFFKLNYNHYITHYII